MALVGKEQKKWIRKSTVCTLETGCSYFWVVLEILGTLLRLNQNDIPQLTSLNCNCVAVCYDYLNPIYSVCSLSLETNTCSDMTRRWKWHLWLQEFEFLMMFWLKTKTLRRAPYHGASQYGDNPCSDPFQIWPLIDRSVKFGVKEKRGTLFLSALFVTELFLKEFWRQNTVSTE